MMPLKDNVDMECFLLTKHSWKGKYKRILSIGNVGISTYNPDKYELTNRWLYTDILSVNPVRSANVVNEFILTVRKDRKVDTVKLSSEYRNDILTSLLKFHKEFVDKPKLSQKYQAYKHHWSGVSLPIVLEVTPCSLDQLDPTTNAILASYDFKDIVGIIGIQNYTGGIVLAVGEFTRLHLFKVINHHEVVQNIVQNAQQYVGIDIKVLPNQITLEQFEKERFGHYSTDQYLTSMSEFVVQKISPRHLEPTKRIMCLTECTILERDPQTYSICTLRPLKDIYALIRDIDNIQMFYIEYKSGLVRCYLTNDRDSLLATLLDSVRSCGNQNVHIRILRTPRGKRVSPFSHPVDEETEAHLLRFIISNYQHPTKRLEVLERFNANIPYSGLNYSVTQESLFAENKERLITSALHALTNKDVDNSQLTNMELEATFHVLRRLLASKVGYAAFTNISGFRESIGTKVVSSLRRNDIAVTYSAIDMLNTLMHSAQIDYDLKQEQLNKCSLLASKTFLESLLDMWTNHIQIGSGALILSAMLDFLTFSLCIPYSETTDGKQFDVLLEMVASRGKFLFKLFQHPSLAIVKGAGLVMKALIEEGETSVAIQMQTLALDEAAICRHLIVSLFSPSNDSTMATHRQLSRHLIGLWITENEDALNLLKRIFPAGLLRFLETEDDVPKSEQEADKLNFRDNLKLAIQHSNSSKRTKFEKQLEGIKHWGLNLVDRSEKINQAMKNRPIVLRNRRQKKRNSDMILNLPLFFYQFQNNHSLPNLIWNHKTREELRIALENELRQFTTDRELAGNNFVAWNYEEFEVQYPSLANEIKIGDYYIRLLLERDDWPQSLVKDPKELFNALYRKVLCRNRINDDQLTVSSLKALAKVYGRYYTEIGFFSDTPYILQMLDRCISPALRDSLLMLIKNLVLEKSNCRPLIDHINCLVDLITLAHLHKGRALPNLKSNLIEAGPNMHLHEEKEWYFNIEKEQDKLERVGPVTFSEMKEYWTNGTLNPRTRCWAVGMDGWRPLQQIPQLKWFLMAKGDSIYNETELAAIILDILIRCTSFFPSRARDGKAVLIPGPKLSRKLSEFLCLPHIVQVCLTHDPGLLERVATLLCNIMKDNPELPKVYLTGVFYFMLMYTGSNILPIAKFLKMTHMKQAFRNEESSHYNIMHRSILGQLLPEAMIWFLENNSAEKFAEIFLGEFDTPEVIWSSEMRRILIEKISAHIADFTPRLKGHTMARYPYLAIPIISYPQLENELFCDIYYLRHLCDERKFPNWPISDPVKLLKHTLDTWRKEVEKKPPQMTVQQAYESLCIDLIKHPNPDESLIRKSYYKLAQIYHPDKNPTGRDVFVKVNTAYEFLCSRLSWSCDGPNPDNIVLILRTQSILFKRYSKELNPYKYAGYPQLIKTIKLEANDEQLFSKSVPLMSAATELCYHTVHCSILNAEELRRVGGIETLLDAYSRCVSILSVDTSTKSLHYQVINNITKCFDVSCNFDMCKKKMLELPQLVVDVCRVVYFKHSLSISLATNLAANNTDFQNNLVKNGVLWSLIKFLFEYDFTLDESGVNINENSNNQQIANNLAKLSILALVSLCGYDMKLIKNPIEKQNISKVEGQISVEQNLIKNKSPSLGTNTNQREYLQNAKNLLQNTKQLQNINFNENIKTDLIENVTSQNENENITKEAPSSDSEIKIIYNISGSPTNVTVKKLLDTLLTPYIANKLAHENDKEILKLLTSNTRNPYLIWDNGTRTQLIEFLDYHRSQNQNGQYETVSEIYDVVKQFSFDAEKDELKIGNIFIKIYNEMPTFPIINPKAFVTDLLEYLKNGYKILTSNCTSNKLNLKPYNLNIDIQSNLTKSKNYSNQDNIEDVLKDYTKSKKGNQHGNTANEINYSIENETKFIDYIIMALKALASVIKVNSNVEIECVGHFEMLFGFLSTSLCNKDREIKSISLEIVSLISRNKECVKEISSCEILGYYLVAMRDNDLKELQLRVLETLSGLINSQGMVKEAHSKGAVIYLLDLFCNSNNLQIREASAELMAKMASDKLSGPKVRISVGKFLPPAFLDAMIDSPQVSVQMFESTHEHPELIWNEKIMKSVSDTITMVIDKFYLLQKQNPKQQWKDPEQLQEIVVNELMISGVYLRLYIQNPGWTLRKPKQFLSDLLDFIVDSISKTSAEKSVLDLSTNALIILLNSQPSLADTIPVLGHIPKLFRQLSIQPENVITVLHELSNSEVCVAAISQTECIHSIKKCMENNKELISIACETLSRLFKCQHDSLILQALDCHIIQFLLGLLEGSVGCYESSPTIKAQIVSALKSMSTHLNYGDRVTHILNNSPIWAEYKDQKHDLFLTISNERGYLTGVNSTAGYLTQGSSSSDVQTVPPPIERNDPLARNVD